MANVKNAAYYNGSGTLKIGDDTYTGIGSFAIVPNTPTEVYRGISGDIQPVVGPAAWQAQITFPQDWKTEHSLSKQSIAWAGQTKTIEYTPADGTDKVTVDVVFQPSQVGGQAGGIPTATLNLDVIGQPTFTAPAS